MTSTEFKMEYVMVENIERKGKQNIAIMISAPCFKPLIYHDLRMIYYSCLFDGGDCDGCQGNIHFIGDGICDGGIYISEVSNEKHSMILL